jgi:hypothetical protein
MEGGSASWQGGRACHSKRKYPLTLVKVLLAQLYHVIIAIESTHSHREEGKQKSLDHFRGCKCNSLHTWHPPRRVAL